MCERRFLLETFPPGLERNAQHLQITDNYIHNTTLKLRKIRVPHTREKSWSLTQFVLPTDGDSSRIAKVRMQLSPAEYEVLSVFEGNEVRKNRFEYVFEDRVFTVDLYLGPLWGLLLARINENEATSCEHIAIPTFAASEITENPLFSGASLAQLTIEEVRKAVASKS